MNPDIVTIQDCIEMHDRRGLGVVLKDGRVAGFQAEKNPIRLILLGEGRRYKT